MGIDPHLNTDCVEPMHFLITLSLSLPSLDQFVMHITFNVGVNCLGGKNKNRKIKIIKGGAREMVDAVY